VVTVKVAVELPGATMTLAGTTADVLLLESVTVAPPAGAAPVKVMVPVEGLPPGTLAGSSVRLDNATGPDVMVSSAVCVTPP
jgi:hypothetical protein